MIYRVKRFSRERSYSILTDLYHSGAKRTAKKWIGRARVKAAKRFYRKSLEELEKGRKAELIVKDKVVNISPESKKKIRAATGQKAKELGVRINTKLPDEVSGLNSWTIKSETLNDYSKQLPDNNRKVRKLKRNARRGKSENQVILSGNNTDIEIGHELGHIENGRKGSIVNRVVNNVANDPEVRTGYQDNLIKMGYMGNHGKSGVKASIGNVVTNKIIRKEEANATKRGIKILKDSGGLTKEELKEAKEYLDLCGKTYEHYGDALKFNTLGNTLNIPSRRGKNIVEQLDR